MLRSYSYFNPIITTIAEDLIIMQCLFASEKLTAHIQLVEKYGEIYNNLLIIKTPSYNLNFRPVIIIRLRRKTWVFNESTIIIIISYRHLVRT